MKNEIYYIISNEKQQRKVELVKRSLSKYVKASNIFTYDEIESLYNRINLIAQNESNSDVNLTEGNDNRAVLDAELTQRTFTAVGDQRLISVLAEYFNCIKNSTYAYIPVVIKNGRLNELILKNDVNSLKQSIIERNGYELDIFSLNGQVGLKSIGLGFDAKLKSYLGTRFKRILTYPFALIKTIFCFRPFYVKIYNNIKSIEGIYWIVTFSTVPKTDQKDFINPFKNINVVLVRPYPPLEFANFLFHLLTNRFEKSQYVKTLSFSEYVTIESTPIEAHIDNKPFVQHEIQNIEVDRLKLFK